MIVVFVQRVLLYFAWVLHAWHVAKPTSFYAALARPNRDNQACLATIEKKTWYPPQQPRSHKVLVGLWVLRRLRVACLAVVGVGTQTCFLAPCLGRHLIMKEPEWNKKKGVWVARCEPR